MKKVLSGAVVSGLIAAFAGSALWAALVPGWGDSAQPWLFWVREVGLAEWGPANSGGIAFCLAGAAVAARAGGITRRRTLLTLALATLLAWFALSTWLFCGLRIQDSMAQQGTGG